MTEVQLVSVEANRPARFGVADGLDANSVCIRTAAEQAGVSHSVLPVRRIRGWGNGVILRLEIGSAIYFYRHGVLSRATPTGRQGRHINGDAIHTTGSKSITKAVIARAGAPVAAGAVFDEAHAADARAFAAALGYPICVKPDHGSKGRLVFPQCASAGQVDAALTAVFATGEVAVVERSVPGEVYRYFYVEPDIVGFRHSRSAGVLGDGHATVAELVERVNAERIERQLPAHDPIRMDGEVPGYLAEFGLGLDTVLPEGEWLALSPVSNFARGGGEGINLTDDDAHPSHRLAALTAFRALKDLKVAAIDMKIADPAHPLDGDNGWVLEINSSPSLESFLFPWRGEPQDVAGAIIEMLQRDAAAHAAADSVPESIPSPTDLDPHAQVLREAADAAGYVTSVVTLPDKSGGLSQPHLRIDTGRKVFQYRRGALRRWSRRDPAGAGRHINRSVARTTSSISETRRLLQEAGLPVPRTRLFGPSQSEEALKYARRLGAPAHVGNDDGSGDDADLRRDFESHVRRAALRNESMLVEEATRGDDLTFFFVDPAVVAVSVSERPAIAGDGSATLIELVDRYNATRADSPAVPADYALVSRGAKYGLGPDSVLPNGQRLIIGDYPDGAASPAPPSVHPEYWQLAKKAAKAVPGFVIGTVIVRALDPTSAPAEGNHRVLRLRSSPALAPFAGTAAPRAITHWIARQEAGNES